MIATTHAVPAETDGRDRPHAVAERDARIALTAGIAARGQRKAARVAATTDGPIFKGRNTP